MIRMFYQMLAPGKTNHVKLMGKIYPLPKGKEWHVPFYSQTQYVVGSDEEACLIKIRQKMQRKWDGFKVLHQEKI